jgi:hypothetical protein
LSINVRLRSLIKRRPRPDVGWSAIKEKEEEEVCTGKQCCVEESCLL